MSASKAQQAATAKRRAQALAMKIAGATYEKIATVLGYANRGAAQKDVKRALDAARAEMTATADEWRDLELLSLDRLQAGLWPAAVGGDHRAADTIGRLIDRRVKLLHLDQRAAPTEGARSLLGELARGLAVAADMIAAEDSTGEGEVDAADAA